MTVKCKWMLHGGKKRRFYVLDLGEGVELATDPWQDGPAAYRAMRGLVRMEKAHTRATAMLHRCRAELTMAPDPARCARLGANIAKFLDKEWNGR